LTYEVDALRVTMLSQGTSTQGIGFDRVVLVVVTAVLVAIGAGLYPRVAT
jgi:ABC-2 type transport system permease protein